MNKSAVWIIILVGAGIAYYWWKNKSNSATGGTAQLDQAVQQDLAYYTAWQQAQNSILQNPQANSPSTGQSTSGSKSNTTTSNTATLPVSV